MRTIGKRCAALPLAATDIVGIWLHNRLHCLLNCCLRSLLQGLLHSFDSAADCPAGSIETRSTACGLFLLFVSVFLADFFVRLYERTNLS